MPRIDTGTRQKLIDTAMDLIWTSSYGSVSVDDICRAAGVRKGSFYHFFPSKQSLAIAAMEEYFEHSVKGDMTQIFAANIPFAAQIDGLADAIMKEKRESLAKYGIVCGCPLAALGSEMIGQEDREIVEKVEEMFAQCRVTLYNAIRAAMKAGMIPDGDAHAKTSEVHDFITGLMMMARIHNSLEGLERDLKPGLRRILALEGGQNPTDVRKERTNDGRL